MALDAKRRITKEDAYEIRFGCVKHMSVKDAALELGLGYSQVYVCREGYTFKNVKSDLSS